MTRKFLQIVAVILIVSLCWTAFCGYRWAWGPFRGLHGEEPAQGAEASPAAADQPLTAEAAPDTAEQSQGTETASAMTGQPQTAEAASVPAPGDGYTLDRVVVLSRHNIRSPLSGSGSLLGEITPHSWFRWTSNPSELSVRGGALETIMGQYFRQRLEQEGLFPENYQPEDGAVRFYANAKQRTIATSTFFAAGLLPVWDAPIETHAAYDTMDPVFSPNLSFVTPEYEEDVLNQITAPGGSSGPEGVQAELKDAITLLMEVADIADSESYQAGTYGDLLTDAPELVLEEEREPAVRGPIKTATSVADALTLQYYEEADAAQAAFGHELTDDDWRKLHSIVDAYTEMLFGTPLLAVNVAHPLLEELRAELTAEGRKFSFLCGHDSNVASVLAALGVEEYTLPNTVEPKTPIGVKLVFSRYLNRENEAYYRVSLVYQSTQQLRKLSLLSPENPPMEVCLQFAGAEAGSGMLIAEEDLLGLFDSAIAAYDTLLEEYADEYQLENAA